MEMEALRNFVILKVNPKAKKKGTIHLPDSVAGGNEDFAEVISVGSLCEGDLKVGDLVLCPEVGDYEWTDEDDGDQLYYLIEENTIPARLRR